ARIELEDVVRHSRRDIGHGPERGSSLLLDAQADEIGDVVLVLPGRGEGFARNLERGASGGPAVEADDGPAARPLGRDDLRPLARDHELTADLEPLRRVAGAF